MPILEVKNLLQAVTPEEALRDVITLAESMKLRARSWRIGSISRFYIVALAEVISRFSVHVALLQASGYNATAWGNALSKFSASRFSNPRGRAVKTQGTVVLSDDAEQGPVTIVAGVHTFPSDDDPTITFRSISGGTLPLGGALQVTVEAESAGERHNIPVGSITRMNPVIAGVGVSNPGAPTDWITRLGVNAQSDDSLRTANPAKWATLGGGAPYMAYEFWALTATQNADGTGDPVGITRVRVRDDNPGGPGTLYVYIADSAGTADAGQVTDVQEYIDARRPRTAVPTVFAATTAGITLEATFTCPIGLGSICTAAISAALEDYINALPIGGEDIGNTLGAVVLSRLVEIAMGIASVKRFQFTAPTTDIALQPNWVATVSAINLTAVEI